MIGESKAARLGQQIQDYIEENALTPGTPLGTKASLAKQHGVSPGTLNEALRLLQVRGYIDSRPGPKGGAFVANNARVRLSQSLLAFQPDPKVIDDYFQVQDALQVLICVEAAASCAPGDAQRIQAAVDKMKAATDPHEVLAGIWEVDREIARTAPNPVLTDIYLGIVDTLQTSVQRFPLSRKITDDVIRLHEDIANAVMSNDVDAAGEAAHRHSPIDYAVVAKKSRATTSR